MRLSFPTPEIDMRPVKNEDVFKYSFLTPFRFYCFVSWFFGRFVGVGDLVLLLYFMFVLLFF